MRVVMWALVAWLFLGPPAAASAPPWLGKRVPVYARVHPEYQQAVADALAFVNANLPQTAPHFIHHAKTPATCKSAKRRRGITICLSDRMTTDFAGAETAIYRQSVVIRVRPAAIEALSTPQSLFCHELFHAVTKISTHDGWDTGPPCPFDVEAAQRVYRHR